MKCRRFIHILNRLIDNEVVKFESEDGTRLEVLKSSDTFYTLTTKSRQDKMMSAVFFNRVEDDGGAIRLCWDDSIAGMVFPVAFEVESESIYS